MTKHLQLFLRTLLIGILTLGGVAQFAATAQTHEITMTTAKKVGDKITLYIDAKDHVNIDGATGTFVNGREIEYTLTKQVVTIKGQIIVLYCKENQLTKLDVSENIALKRLICWGNQLASLDVSKNVALTGLYCSANQLTTLDVSKNTALIDLSCSENQLTSLDVSNNIALKRLICSSNQLAVLDVSKSIALIFLSCFANQLTTLDVSKNGALEGLYCNFNQLTDLDLSKSMALTELRCHTNRIKGEAMTALVKSLPTRERGEFCVIDTKNPKEQNVCTKEQVAIAKDKGWRAMDLNGSWLDRKDYEGSESNSVAAIDSRSIQIYPNPAMDFVRIEGANASTIVRLYSLDGRLILTSRADADGAVRLDVSTLATGEYLLIVGSSYSQRISIAR